MKSLVTLMEDEQHANGQRNYYRKPNVIIHFWVTLVLVLSLAPVLLFMAADWPYYISGSYLLLICWCWTNDNAVREVAEAIEHEVD